MSNKLKVYKHVKIYINKDKIKQTFRPSMRSSSVFFSKDVKIKFKKVKLKTNVSYN